eukprot:5774640-Heterocapsa_arctica.AAC.1
MVHGDQIPEMCRSGVGLRIRTLGAAGWLLLQFGGAVQAQGVVGKVRHKVTRGCRICAQPVFPRNFPRPTVGRATVDIN